MRLSFLFVTVALFCSFLATAQAGSLPVNSGLLVWLDASDTSTIVVNGANETGDWTDKASSYTAVACDGNCIYDEDAFTLNNGDTVGGVVLDGNSTADDAYMFTDAAAGNISTESLTIFVAGKFNPEADEYLLTKRGSTEAGYRFSSKTGGTQIRYQAGSVSSLRDMDFESTTVFGVVHDRSVSGANTIAMYADGTMLGAVESVANVATLYDAQNLYIGSNQGINNAIAGDFGEVLIYNRALSTTEVDSVNAYLMEKWVTGTEVPEPSTLAMLLIGTLGIVALKTGRLRKTR